MHATRTLLLIVAFTIWRIAAGANAPPVMLANVYQPGAVDVSEYWVSEKYDGVRAWWDGRTLWTRTGKPIHAPAWFTAGWPDVTLDGELWINRGRFQDVVAVVRDRIPDDAAWREVKYMAFDLPSHGGVFTERLEALVALVREARVPWLRVVPQSRVADEASLERMLSEVLARGGEGLMLHRGASFYRAGRSDDLLKLKPFEDAEARVVGYAPGQGKYAGMVGALIVERADGLRFRLGAGLSDAERRDPPPVGSWVTYAYQGHTRSGAPRFARFLRVRPDFEEAALEELAPRSSTPWRAGGRLGTGDRR